MILNRDSGAPVLGWDVQLQVSTPPSCRIRIAAGSDFLSSLQLHQPHSVYATVQEQGNQISFEVFSGVVSSWEVEERPDGMTVVLSLSHPVWEKLKRYVPLVPVVYAGIDDPTSSPSTAVQAISDVLQRVGVVSRVTLPDTLLGGTVTWSNQSALSIIGSILSGAGYTVTSKYYADLLVDGSTVKVFERSSTPTTVQVPYNRVVSRRVSCIEPDASRMSIRDPEHRANVYPVVIVGGSRPVVEKIDPRKETGIKRCDDRFTKNPGDPSYEWQIGSDDEWPDEDYSDRRTDPEPPDNARDADEECLAVYKDVYMKEERKSYSRTSEALQRREAIQSFVDCILRSEHIVEYNEVTEGNKWTARRDITDVEYEYESFDMGDKERPVLKLTRKVERVRSSKRTSDQCMDGWPIIYRVKEETWRYAYAEGELFPEYHQVAEWSPHEDDWICGAPAPDTILRTVEHEWVTKSGEQLIRRSAVYTYDANGKPESTVYSSQTSLGDWVGRGRIKKEMQRESKKVAAVETARDSGAPAVPRGRGSRLPGIPVSQQVVFPDAVTAVMRFPAVGMSWWIYAGTLPASMNRSVVRTPCEPPHSHNERVVYKPLLSSDETGLPSGQLPARTVSLPLIGSQAWLDTIRSRIHEEIGLKILVADVDMVPTPSVVPGVRVTFTGDSVYGSTQWYITEVQWAWESDRLTQRVVMMTWV